MSDNILNNWQFLNAKAIELQTLTKAVNPKTEGAINRVKELAAEISETVDLIKQEDERL